jgi:hypothetical protein
LKKLLAVLTGYKTELQTLQKKVYLYPMEEARADGDFYLHTPQSTLGSYSITFSCPGYDDYSETFSTKNHISDVVILLEQSGAPFP